MLEYVLKYNYSEGTDDFDRWDEMKRFRAVFQTPKDLIDALADCINIRKDPIEDLSIIEYFDGREHRWDNPYGFIKDIIDNPEIANHIASTFFVKTGFMKGSFKKLFGEVELPKKESKKDSVEGDSEFTYDFKGFSMEELKDISIWITNGPNCIFLSPNIESFIRAFEVFCNNLSKSKSKDERYQQYLKLKKEFENVDE